MSVKTKEITLSNGEIAVVQAIPYMLWCELEDERDSMLEESGVLSKEQNFNAANACVLRAQRNRREKTLAVCVRDWPRLREVVGLDDVLVLEKAVEKLSVPDLEAENLSSAAAGAATQPA